jgi:hypothetical protein
MRKSIKSKIIFLIFKKTHGHSKPPVGTKIQSQDWNKDFEFEQRKKKKKK